MDEERIRNTRTMRQPARSLCLKSHGDEPRFSVAGKAIGSLPRDGFAWSSKRNQRPELRGAPAARRQPLRKIGRRRSIAQQTADPRPTGKMRHEALEGRCMQSEANGLFERPAQTRRSEREGRGRGISNPLVPVQPRGEDRTHAKPERIARSKRDGRPPSKAQYAFRIEWCRPAPAAGADIGEREMALAAKNRLGTGKRFSACLRQTGEAIFADTDNGQ